MLKLQLSEKTFFLPALWMLEEVGAPYVLASSLAECASVSEAPLGGAAYFQAPVLTDHQVRLSDPVAVCIYLAERFPEAGLAPFVGDPARSVYFHWLFFPQACLAPQASSNSPREYLMHRVSFYKMLAAFERRLSGGEWILTDRFSAADIVSGSLLLFGEQHFGMPLNAGWARDYLWKCKSRPGFRRAFAISEAA